MEENLRVVPGPNSPNKLVHFALVVAFLVEDSGVLRGPMSEAKMKSVRLGEKDTSRSLHSHLASHPVILCDTLVYSLGR